MVVLGFAWSSECAHSVLVLLEKSVVVGQPLQNVGAQSVGYAILPQHLLWFKGIPVTVFYVAGSFLATVLKVSGCQPHA